MNGRAARRIRRAAYQVLIRSGAGRSKRQIIKQLKREYRDLPYHRRKAWGYTVLSHRDQERRYRRLILKENA